MKSLLQITQFFLATVFLSAPIPAEEQPARPNVLLITADDLNYDSLGVYGCQVPNITPNLDRLADSGLVFHHGYVNIAVCQPSRQSLMTGRYPHRNGAEGFDPISDEVPTLQECLNAAGYLNGILGKEIHLRPKHRYCWDHYITQGDLASGAGIGRSPERYHHYTKVFLDRAKTEKKSFFLMANIHDPHRPFAGSAQELRSWGKNLPKVTRTIKEIEITVPDFLADLPEVRKEVAEYYTSVHRCDQSAGAILKALDESGFAKNTIVMFLSDNGIAVPFAKANCYLNSTKTPWIVSWPGTLQPEIHDKTHLVSGIDFMPTILEATGLKSVPGMDGRSFLPLLKGKAHKGPDFVFTEFHKTFARNCFPMRAVHGKRYGYLVNFWANRTKPMRMDSTSGLTFNALKKAAPSDPQIAARVQLFEHRVLEEFFDFENDPHALNNLIDDPVHRDEIEKMRAALLARMKKTGDPALEAFQHRSDPAALDRFMEAQRLRAKPRKAKPSKKSK
jgi:N-sulfoglucosamine sulfohydrolase